MARAIAATALSTWFIFNTLDRDLVSHLGVEKAVAADALNPNQTRSKPDPNQIPGKGCDNYTLIFSHPDFNRRFGNFTQSTGHWL
jgi:hypothetical protein